MSAISLIIIIPTPFKKGSGDIVIASILPSVCPFCYLLNHWTKSNQIWCVVYSHEWSVQKHIIFGLAPLGRGQNLNIIKFQLQSQF